MRLSELLRADVRDGNGRLIGVVRDVRATVDQEEGGSWSVATVDVLVVGPRWRPRPGTDRPAVFGWLDRRFRARSRAVPWNRVESIEDGVVHVRASG
jgi:sporulation protein YlmC with PRC-barrel domain